MRIGVMGPQGSGKSTQSQLIARELNLPVIDTGGLIRQKAGEDSEIGRRIKATIESGHLIDFQVTADLLQLRLSQPDCQKGFIVDGYPRSLEQLGLFDPGYDQVIYLDISDEVAIKRLQSRGRSDDTPEAIKNRLEIFHQQTNQVTNYYEKRGRLIRIGAEYPPAETFARIKERLNEFIG